MSDIQKFSYGRDEFKDAKCPARSAGYNPSEGDGSTPVSQEFDILVREMGFSIGMAGVISEEEAREAWLEALDRFEVGSHPHDTAMDVALEHGWLE